MQEKKDFALQSVLDSIYKVLIYFVGLLVIFQVLSVTFDVILRLLFGFSVTTIVALNEWSMVYITFLGFAWLQREGGHVKMDIFVEKFKPKNKAIFNMFGYIMGIFVSTILIVFGMKVTWMQVVEKTFDYFKIPGFPTAIIVIAIPLGCLLLLLQLLVDVKKCFNTYKELSNKTDDKKS